MQTISLKMQIRHLPYIQKPENVQQNNINVLSRQSFLHS